MNGNELIAKILKREGVEWIACFPSNPLIEAVAKEGIRPIAFRHERGAVMAADGFSRTSDRQRFGVVAVQNQAGAENSLGGIAQAAADNIPILFLPGGVPLNWLDVRPNYSIKENYRGLVKHVETVYRPDQVTTVMRRAFAGLRNGAPGPMVVELAADVCAADTPNTLDDYHSPTVATHVPAASDIKAAAQKLVDAERPLLWAGGGVLFSRATEQLRELAELLAAPVFTTMQGKSAIDERHPLALGAGSGATTGPAHEWLGSCDLILALGSSLTRTGYAQAVPQQAFLIQNSNNPDEIGKDEAVDIGLVGDTKLTLQALIDEVKALIGGPRDSSAVAAEVATIRAAWREEWAPLLHSDEQPLNTYRVIHEIN